MEMKQYIGPNVKCPNLAYDIKDETEFDKTALKLFM